MFGKKSAAFELFEVLSKRTENLRTALEHLKDRIETLERRIPEGAQAIETVACDVCGCLVPKHLATKGKSEIRVRSDYILRGDTIPANSKVIKSNPTTGAVETELDYIHTPYYCKIHGYLEDDGK